MKCINGVYYRQISGRTKTAEAGQETQTVNIFYTDPIEQIPVVETLPFINYTQVMAIDKQTSDARFI